MIETLPPLHSLVAVNWIDIVVDGGWVDKEKMESVSAPHPVDSIGYLSYVGEKYLVLSSSLSKNGPDQYNNHITIPLGCIESVVIV